MKTAHDLVAAAKTRVQELSPDAAEQAIRDADVLIDVRETEEFAAGHVPGAVHMSRGMLEFKLSSTPELTSRDIRIVLYCKTSGRAALTACALHDMGSGWQKSGGNQRRIVAAFARFNCLRHAPGAGNAALPASPPGRQTAPPG